jgi:hypothetical protein
MIYIFMIVTKQNTNFVNNLYKIYIELNLFTWQLQIKEEFYYLS